jgi:hypothetical protein
LSDRLAEKLSNLQLTDGRTLPCTSANVEVDAPTFFASGIYGGDLERLATGFSELTRKLRELRDTIWEIGQWDGPKQDYLCAFEGVDESDSMASDLEHQCEMFDHVSDLFLRILQNKT